MRINHNLAALNTYSKLSEATGAQSKSLEKLSSGQRINRAGDDAAGLAISEKMRAQIKGLDQAARNAQDGISMIQTAEGALSETHAILQRMRELAVQAGNDTNTSDDRTQIQAEVDQLTSEINRIAGNTEFNKQKLLDGGMSMTSVAGFTKTIAKVGTDSQAAIYSAVITCWDNGTCQICFHADGTGTAISVVVNACSLGCQVAQIAQQMNANLCASTCWLFTSVGNKIIWTNTLTCTNVADNYNDCVNMFNICTNRTYICQNIQVQRETCYVNGVTQFSFTNDTMKEGTVMVIGGANVALWDSSKGNYASCLDFITQNHLDQGYWTVYDITSAGAACWNTAEKLMGCLSGAGNVTPCSGATLLYDTSNKRLCLEAACAGSRGNAGVAVSIYALNNTIAVAGNGTTLQIGANVNQTFKAFFGNMTAGAIKISGTVASSELTTSSGAKAYLTSNLNITDKDGKTTEFSLDISTAEKATAAVAALDDAISAVSSERSRLGAYQNRLEHTITNLGTSSENLTAAESRIRDVDMAKEMMSFNKNNILNQAATAMLAQANQQPQSVLQLLR